MRWKHYSALLGVVVVLLVLLYLTPIFFSSRPAPVAVQAPAPVSSPFIYSFNVPGTLFEAGNAALSSSAYWWLDSGGILKIEDGVGKTVQGELPSDNFWAKTYAHTNPTDTDGGSHPQNIFRLVSRSMWYNFSEVAYFKINTYHLSASPQRMESNGLLLFARYENESNLYYLGIRVDGTAVIKKKLNGIYYTLAQTPIISGTYDHDKNPNLLPLGEWVGLKALVSTDGESVVHLKLSTDFGNTGVWKQVLDTTDSGTGVSTIDTAAYTGIRTDFMDVDIDNFRLEEIQ